VSTGIYPELIPNMTDFWRSLYKVIVFFLLKVIFENATNVLYMGFYIRPYESGSRRPDPDLQY
jgi:hypothetical protein